MRNHAGDGVLEWLDREHPAWQAKSFPDAPTGPEQEARMLMGVVEEVGELSHAILKGRQGIRGSKREHDAAFRDAVGDVVVFLTALCEARGVSIVECVESAWSEVRQRDWSKHRQDGVVR